MRPHLARILCWKNSPSNYQSRCWNTSLSRMSTPEMTSFDPVLGNTRANVAVLPITKKMVTLSSETVAWTWRSTLKHNQVSSLGCATVLTKSPITQRMLYGQQMGKRARFVGGIPFGDATFAENTCVRHSNRNGMDWNASCKKIFEVLIFSIL